MIGKIRFLGGMRNFAQKAINRLENGKTQIQTRELRMIFCAGDEEPDEVESRNLKTRREIEGETKQGRREEEKEKRNFSEDALTEDELSISQSQTQKTEMMRLRFVRGDEDLATSGGEGTSDTKALSEQSPRQKFVQGDEDLLQGQSEIGEKTTISQAHLPRMKFRPIKN